MDTLPPLPFNSATIAISTTAGPRACYQIFLQCVATGAKGPLYDAFDVGTDGKCANRLVSRSRTAALDVARLRAVLGMEGCLEVWHVGANAPCMFLDITTAARLSVTDSELQGPRFSSWKPFDPTQRAETAIAPYPSEQGAASV